jgi:hypothetical protein
MPERDARDDRRQWFRAVLVHLALELQRLEPVLGPDEEGGDRGGAFGVRGRRPHHEPPGALFRRMHRGEAVERHIERTIDRGEGPGDDPAHHEGMRRVLREGDGSDPMGEHDLTAEGVAQPLGHLGADRHLTIGLRGATGGEGHRAIAEAVA